MQIYPLRLLPSGMSFDFVSFRRVSYVLSILLSILSIALVLTKQFNFGIDFAGGITMEIRAAKELDIKLAREVLNKLDIGEVAIAHFGTQNDLSIRVGIKGESDLMASVDKIKSALREHFDYSIEYRKVDFVGPQVGAELIYSGLMALSLSFVGIMIYIWARFEWYFGLGVLIALIHDAILALGFMSLTGLDFNLSSIAAILTVIGYSVNDSVVIYDRIRENLRKYSKKPIAEIINISVNETLSRTTLTVLTTLLANLSLIVFGGEALHSFSMLVFVGIIAGTYSSIFISAPILTALRPKG